MSRQCFQGDGERKPAFLGQPALFPFSADLSPQTRLLFECRRRFRAKSPLIPSHKCFPPRGSRDWREMLLLFCSMLQDHGARISPLRATNRKLSHRFFMLVIMQCTSCVDGNM